MRARFSIIGCLALTLLGFWLLEACVGVHEEVIQPVPVIDPEDGSADIGTRFFHRVFVFDFTATWCQYCPDMARALEEVKRTRPGRVVEIAVHQYDDMSAMVCDTIVASFPYHGFPAVVFDYDAATYQQKTDTTLLLAYVDKTVPAAACGIAIDARDTAQVQVKVQAVESGQYRLAVALVQDGIVARQTGAGDNYVNNAVLLGYLSASFRGDELGWLDAGTECTRTYAAEAGENRRIVASLLRQCSDGTYVAAGAAQCRLNQQIDYRYEQD